MPGVFPQATVKNYNNPQNIATLGTNYYGQRFITEPNYRAKDALITTNTGTAGAPYGWASDASSGVTNGRFNSDVVTYSLDIIGTTTFKKFIEDTQIDFVYSAFAGSNNGLTVPQYTGRSIQVGRMFKAEPGNADDHRLIEGETPMGQKLEAERLQFDIRFFGAVWKYTDMTEQLSTRELIASIRDVVAYHAKAVMELEQKEEILNSGNYLIGSGGASIELAGAFDPDDVRDAEQYLVTHGAKPITGIVGGTDKFESAGLNPSYVMITNPASMSTIESKPYVVATEPNGFLALKRYSNGGVGFHAAEMGSVARNTRVLQSNRAPIFVAGSTITGSGLTGTVPASTTLAISTIFAKDAYMTTGMAGQMGPKFYTVGDSGGNAADPLAQLRFIGYKMNCKTVIWDPQLIVNLVHKI